MEPRILERLHPLAEESYRKFSQSLIPDGLPLLGVRMGQLRRLAKELSREGWDPFARMSEDTFHEETLLRALAIAYAPVSEERRIAMITAFLPRIDNWAVCDSMCTTFDRVDREPGMYLALIERHRKDSHPYARRFSVVMLLFHFLGREHLDQVMASLATTEQGHYYVDMAIAWAAATGYAKFPDTFGPWLETIPFPRRTMMMTIGKIRDSRQVSPEAKARAASWKHLL